MDQTIRCPKCGADIPLTEAISKQIEDRLRRQYEAESEGQKKLLAKREESLGQKENDLKRREESVTQEVARAVDRQKAELLEAAVAEAAGKTALEMTDLREQVKEKEATLAVLRKEQLDLRKQKREIEEREAQLKLDVERQLDKERGQIAQKVRADADEQYRLQIREKEEKIDGMVRQIEEMRRRAEQGSQQSQGEVLELELEDLLREMFPRDTIVPVPKGMRGADVTQRVIREDGQVCGAIVWECKRTKSWSKSWIEKIKDDQRQLGAEIAVIASEVLPEGVKPMGYVDGVWVTGLGTIVCLGTALRMNLIGLANVRAASQGKNEKMEAIYQYLSGPQFRQRVEGIVEAFRGLQEDLDKEKRAMSSIWAKREKQIDRVVAGTTRMYGDMQAIVGASMQEIEALNLRELPGPEGKLDVFDILPEE